VSLWIGSAELEAGMIIEMEKMGLSLSSGLKTNLIVGRLRKDKRREALASTTTTTKIASIIIL
jgi:hypothetical protein